MVAVRTAQTLTARLRARRDQAQLIDALLVDVEACEEERNRALVERDEARAALAECDARIRHATNVLSFHLDPNQYPGRPIHIALTTPRLDTPSALPEPIGFSRIDDPATRVAVAQAFPEHDNLPRCLECANHLGAYVCTRAVGHAGPHVTHSGRGNEALAWWPAA